MKLPFDVSHHSQGKTVGAKHFLVVDDDETVRGFLADFLKAQGCECDTASAPSEVLPWLEKNPCDAVILDLNLGHDPNEGFVVLKKVRAAHPKLPIVILTGAGYDEDKLQTAIHDGANGYISKTIPPLELFAALMRAIQTTHAHRA